MCGILFCHRYPKSFVTLLSAKIKISDIRTCPSGRTLLLAALVIDIVEGEENTFSSPASIQEVVKSAHPWKRSPQKPNIILHKDPFVKKTGSFFMPKSGCRQQPEKRRRSERKSDGPGEIKSRADGLCDPICGERKRDRFSR